MPSGLASPAEAVLWARPYRVVPVDEHPVFIDHQGDHDPKGLDTFPEWPIVGVTKGESHWYPSSLSGATETWVNPVAPPRGGGSGNDGRMWGF